MATNQARENILHKIREALKHPVPLPFLDVSSANDLYTKSNKNNIELFFESFTKIQGHCLCCKNEAELKNELSNLFIQKGWSKIYCEEKNWIDLLNAMQINPYEDLSNCDVSITGCEYLIARTGTIILSSQQKKGRTASIYAPIHICIAFTNQIVADLKDTFLEIEKKYKTNLPSLITFATGPSRTADIEKTLVTGVHGPKEVFCFLVES